MEGRINAAPIRKWAVAELELTSNMYWAIQKRLEGENRIKLTKDTTRNANHMSIEHARVLIDELKAHPNAKDSGAPLPEEIAAAASVSPPPPPPPKETSGEAPTAAELATRTGPQGTAKTTPTDPPEPPGEEEAEEPRHRVKISKNAWKWIVLVGVGVIGIAVARSWWIKRKAAQPAAAAPNTTITEDPLSPEAMREQLIADGIITA